MPDEIDETDVVARMTYLPRRLDRIVGSIAFTRGVSRNVVITELLIDGLERFEESGGKTLAQRLNELGKKHR